MLPLSIGEVAVLRKILLVVEIKDIMSNAVDVSDVNLATFDVAGKESFGIVVPPPRAVVAQHREVVSSQHRRVKCTSPVMTDYTVI